MRTPCHSSRWRSFSTTTSVPSAASSAARSALGVVDRRRAGSGSRAPRRRPAGRTAIERRRRRGSSSRSFSRPDGDAEVGVALAQDAAVLARRARGTTASERSGSGSSALSSTLRRGADTAASLVRLRRHEPVRWGHGRRPRPAAPAAVDPARPRHAARRVPRDARRRGDDPRLRGDARAARGRPIEVQTPLETAAGTRGSPTRS